MGPIIVWSTRHPLMALGLLSIITAGLAAGLPRLEIDTSTETMIPQDHPLVVAGREMKETFGNDKFLLISIEREDLYSIDTMERVEALTKALQALPDVEAVYSPTNMEWIGGSDGDLQVEPLWQGDLARFEGRIREDRLYHGLIRSIDGKALSLYVKVKRDEDHDRLVAGVQQVVEQEAGPGLIHIEGLPMAHHRIGAYISQDLTRFLPLSFLVVGLIFLASFRSARGLLLPMACEVLSIVWTLGLMGWLGRRLTIVGVMLPSLLIAVASSYGIHIVTQYYKEARVGEDRLEVIRRAMDRILRTVFLAGLTTVAGFLSQVTNSVSPIREFGIFASVGVVSGVLSATLLIPAALTFFRLPSRETHERVNRGVLARALHRLGAIDHRYRWALLGATVLLMAMALTGIPRLKIESNPVLYFKEGSTFRQGATYVSKRFGGAWGAMLVFDTGAEGGIKEPDLLRAVAATQKFAEEQYGVGMTYSVVDLLRRVDEVMRDDAPSGGAVPTTRTLAAQYLLLYSMSADPEQLSRFVDHGQRRANLFVRLGATDGRAMGVMEVRDVMERIVARARQLAPREGSLLIDYHGEPKNVILLSEYIVEGQIVSLLLSLLFVFITCSLLFRSPLIGLVSTIPLAVALMINFGVMGWLGIELDVATTLISSVAIGIGIDDTIHYILRYRQELRRGAEPLEATQETLKHAGMAIIFTSLALILGFGILVLSNFKPVILFGLLLGLTLLGCTLGALVVLPALLLIVKPKFKAPGHNSIDE